MNDKQIQAFLMICELGSMNQAAEQLYISQPALKKRMDMLEEELGTVLFRRSSGGCELTAAGNLFLEGVRPIHQQMETLKAEIKRMKMQKELRICTLPDISMIDQDERLIAFTRENPDVICRQVALPTEEWMERLQRRQVDLFQCYYTAQRLKRFKDLGLCFAPKSKKAKLACVLSSQHPLAGKHAISFEELRDHPVFAGPLLYHYSGLLDYAQGKKVNLQCAESAGKRYEMISKCEKGAIYIHPVSYAGGLKPLAVIPLRGFSCLSGWIWREECSDIVQRFLEYCE